jgi:hypothetical protein
MNTRRKYTKEVLQEAVDNSESIAGVIKFLGLKLAGGTQTNIATRIKEYDIDTSHFLGPAWRKGKTFSNESKPASFYLKMLEPGVRKTEAKFLRRSMIEFGISYECKECGLPAEWNGKPLTLQVDHIDGNWYNNTIENLRFLCGNCHCQTETWGRTKGSGA